jgi:N-acetylneuraminic acid mutarotase
MNVRVWYDIYTYNVMRNTWQQLYTIYIMYTNTILSDAWRNENLKIEIEF